MDRNTTTTQPLVSREDIPPDQNENNQVKSTIPPKTLPKPIISTTAFIRKTDSVCHEYIEVQNRQKIFSSSLEQ